MRLVAFPLMAALAGVPLAAQGRQPLPWEQAAPLAWQVDTGPLPTAAGPAAEPMRGPLALEISGDGTLKVSDALGRIRLQAGLPGRPLKAWRDGGLALPVAQGRWVFPEATPLLQGLGALQWCAADFRPFLQGLCWVLEDGEAFLTVIHPATARLIHLPLPGGQGLDLAFLPDRLVVTGTGGGAASSPRWSLPWMGLLPRLAALGPQATPPATGTAMAPFPRE